MLMEKCLSRHTSGFLSPLSSNLGLSCFLNAHLLKYLVHQEIQVLKNYIFLKFQN